MLNNTICLLTHFQEQELISLSETKQKEVQLKGEPSSVSASSFSPGCGERDILFHTLNQKKVSVTEQLKLDIRKKKQKQESKTIKNKKPTRGHLLNTENELSMFAQKGRSRTSSGSCCLTHKPVLHCHPVPEQDLLPPPWPLICFALLYYKAVLRPHRTGSCSFNSLLFLPF